MTDVARPECGIPYAVKGIGIVNGTKNFEEAQRFAEWFGSAQIQGEWAEKFGTMPTNELAADKADPRQPGLHVRSPEGVRLDDEEMIRYYAEKIHKLGGRVTAYYLDGTAIKTENGCFTFMPTQKELLKTAFTMTSEPVEARKPGWPLDSLSYDREGVSFLSPTRRVNAQAGWGYAPRLRKYVAELLQLQETK